MLPSAPPQHFFAQATEDAPQSCCSGLSCCHPQPSYQLLFGYGLSAPAQSQAEGMWPHISTARGQTPRYALRPGPWWFSGCLQGETNLREGSASLAERPSHLNPSHANQSSETPANALEQLRAEVGTRPTLPSRGRGSNLQ